MITKGHLQGTVTSIAFGGEGIVRHNGQVVFIPFVTVGDEIEYEIIESKKSFARGRLLNFIIKATSRTTPKCLHFGACGGCQFQHMPYADQLAHKRDFVLHAMQRIGGIKDAQVKPVVGANAEWNYRKVVRLKFHKNSDGFSMAYVDYTSRHLVQVSHCPIFSENQSLWSDIHTFLSTVFSNAVDTAGQISLFKSKEKLVALIELPSWNLNTPKLPPFVQGIMIVARGKRLTVGDVSLSLSYDGNTYQHTPMSFVQNHEEQSRNIYNKIKELVLNCGAQNVLDLYCGFGIISIALAKHNIRVTGVEINQDAIDLAISNARDNGVEPDFICQDVADFFRHKKTNHFDFIIVNPPRTGLAKPVAEAIGKSSCSELIYVSCMPQTLARDLKILAGFGFSVQLCQPYDMFPQTTHVETLVHMTR